MGESFNVTIIERQDGDFSVIGDNVNRGIFSRWAEEFLPSYKEKQFPAGAHFDRLSIFSISEDDFIILNMKFNIITKKMAWWKIKDYT